MSYQVHNFQPGDVLLASQLNEMDNQIALNESSSALKSSIANEFSTSSTYAVGDYVIYEGQLYQCTTAVTTAGSWNSSNWTQAVLGNDVSDLRSAFNIIPLLRQGTFSSGTGNQESSTTRLVTNLLFLRAGSKVVFERTNFDSIYGYYTLPSKMWTVSGGWSTSDVKFEAPFDCIFEIQFRKPNNSTVMPSDFTDTFYILGKNENDNLFPKITAIVTPEMYGAAGDGTTDDTAALQATFDNTTTEVIVLTGRYLVTSTILSYKPKNIVNLSQNGAIFGSLNIPILKFQKSENEASDYRNYYMKNVNVSQAGPSQAVAFVGWGDRIMNFEFDNCHFFSKGGLLNGYGLYAENSLAHSIVHNCEFSGNGIYFNCRDANLIESCLFFGEGNGIVLDTASYGCLNNAVRDCTIVNYGGNAIKILGSEQVVIENNQIEYGSSSVSQTATDKAMIVLDEDSDEHQCGHILILNNNFGGGSQVTNQVLVKNAYDTVIERNRFVKLSSYNIVVNAASVRTTIKRNNYRTTDEGVLSALNVNALGEVIGYPVVFTNSGVVSLTFIKGEDGFVNIRFFNLLADGIVNIANIPSWLVNGGYQCIVSALSPTGLQYYMYIRTTGVVALNRILKTESGIVLDAPNETGLYMPQAQYYADYSY